MLQVDGPHFRMREKVEGGSNPSSFMSGRFVNRENQQMSTKPTTIVATSSTEGGSKTIQEPPSRFLHLSRFGDVACITCSARLLIASHGGNNE
jgi:hypothetical protein